VKKYGINTRYMIEFLSGGVLVKARKNDK